MNQQETIVAATCYHCGADCLDEGINANGKNFCCAGCKTVYEILADNKLDGYYALNEAPGISNKNRKRKDFSFLSNAEIREKLLDFSDNGVSVITLFLPAIHCSSCIWLLENLSRLKKGVLHVQVNFPKRTARITFNEADINLVTLAELLSAIGYDPLISLEDTEEKKEKKDRSPLYKLAIAGFAFGNIMIMALPEYFEADDSTLHEFLPFFRWLMLALAIPVVVYSASDYFISAYKGLKHRYMNIDVPIAVGIAAIFLRSSYEVIFGIGPGYFDSLTGLVFFLLLGKFFQRKTYDTLSFERDYKSYFPVAVTRLNDGEENIPVNNLVKGDRILIRNEELIPADCILLKGRALIDNSFVTGEATPIAKVSGDKIYAGGKQLGEAIELQVIKPVNQSYLTQLWNHDIFQKERSKSFKNLTDRRSKSFSLIIMGIAVLAAGYWFTIDAGKAFTVFTAILIVACPCALALSAPFTHGNVLRMLGKNKFFVKDADSVERLSEVTHIVWDKTGTLTQSRGTKADYVGQVLSHEEKNIFYSLARQSNHPLSRLIHQNLKGKTIPLQNYTEHAGKGAKASHQGVEYALGSAVFTGAQSQGNPANETRVYLSANGVVKGFFKVENIYRPGIFQLINRLGGRYRQSLLSGDGAGEQDTLLPVFGGEESLRFSQKPHDKLNHIKQLQAQGNHVLMVGDGLNDAGALRQSDVGISLSEDVNTFSPACDAILDASAVSRLDTFLLYTRQARKIIYISFVLSFSYNIIGLAIAAMGYLSPVVCAILMPLSSITIVVFVTAASSIAAKRVGLV